MFKIHRLTAQNNSKVSPVTELSLLSIQHDAV